MALDEARLVKLAALAGRSDKDGEALNALRAMANLLRSAETSLEEVVAAGARALARGTAPTAATAAGSTPRQGDARPRHDQRPRPSTSPREVVVTSKTLPSAFKGRFEILSEGLSKGRKPMAHVKVTASQTFDDIVGNAVRVAYPTAYWEVMPDLRALDGQACIFTLRPAPAGEGDVIASLRRA